VPSLEVCCPQHTKSNLYLQANLSDCYATLELNLKVFEPTASPFARNMSKLNVQVDIFYRKTMENVLSNIIKNHGN
jgi:hypothetical protein